MKVIGMVIAGYFVVQGAYELIPMETPLAFLDGLPDWGSIVPAGATSQMNWAGGLLDLATALAAWHFIVRG